MKTNTKKLLSVLLALMMLLSIVPFYASAEPIALTTANVVTWPTTSGEIWFGQKLSDGITLNSENALVTSDGTATGTVIPGKWEFDPDFVPTSAGTTARFTIVFTPDDTDNYSGFERANGREVTCVVNKVTPVFVDETNDPVVATDVELGATLSTSTITGGQMKNPYTGEVINKSWQWTIGNTKVNSAGEYNIYFNGGSGYNRVNSTVSVKLIGTMQETEIVTPEAVTVEYSPSTKYGDIPLVGVKAVIKGTATEVPGTFSSKWADIALDGVGTYNVPIVFTPNDTENYIVSEGTISVTVTKANYKFVNENGEEIVPEITLPYGSTFDQGGALGVALKNMIKDRALLTGTDIIGGLTFEAGDKNTVAPLGTNTYNVLVRPYNSDSSNYNATNLQFVLTIEPATVDIVVRSAIDNNVRTLTIAVKDPYGPRPQGTFALYIDGVLLKEGLKTGEKAEWAPTVSKAYDMKVVYTPVENDPCVVEDYTTTSSVRLVRYLTRINTLGSGVENYFGDEVKLLANVPDENFGGWKITDASGNEITLEGAVIEGKNITFTMPDYDITVEAIDKTQSSGDGSGSIDDIFGGFGDLTEGDSDNPIVNFFNNIIAWFRNLIETIKSFFRGIGNVT